MTPEEVMLRVITTKSENVAVVCLPGRLVIGETKTLHQTVQSLSNVGAVILEMGRVNTIDAHGLGVLLELRRQLQAKESELQLRNVTELVSRVLEITRLNSVFEVTSGAQALAANLHGRSMPAKRPAPCAWLTPSV